MKKFCPQIYQKNIYSINYQKLKKEGIKCLLFDLDNTCIPYKNNKMPKKIKDLFDKLVKMNFKVIIFSNSPKRRLQRIIELNNLKIEYNASSKKPLPHNYKKVLKKYNYQKEEVCIIGDQLLTDVFGGNKVGIKTCLVDPITKKEFFITKISRKIENNLFKKLSKQNKLTKGEYYD